MEKAWEKILARRWAGRERRREVGGDCWVGAGSWNWAGWCIWAGCWP
jgi:hypothetical protein